MAINQRLMRPKRSGPRPAEPSITVTTQGVDGVQEEFTVSGGVDEIVTFSDGSNGGNAIFYSDGTITGATAPDGYDQQGSTGGTSLSFLAQSAMAKPDMVKTSGGGGSIDVTAQGADGVAEVWELDLDGATAGTFKITDGSLTTGEIAWNIDAGTLEGELETAFGVGCFVSGSNGDFEIIFDDWAERDDPSIVANLLTK